MTRTINKYNDIFQDVLPEHYVFRSLKTQVQMYHRAMHIYNFVPMNKITPMNSAFHQLPDCYSKLSTDNKLSIYNQVYTKQQKDIAWRQRDLLIKERDDFEDSLEHAILCCDSLTGMM